MPPCSLSSHKQKRKSTLICLSVGKKKSQDNDAYMVQRNILYSLLVLWMNSRYKIHVFHASQKMYTSEETYLSLLCQATACCPRKELPSLARAVCLSLRRLPYPEFTTLSFERMKPDKKLLGSEWKPGSEIVTAYRGGRCMRFTATAVRAQNWICGTRHSVTDGRRPLPLSCPQLDWYPVN